MSSFRNLIAGAALLTMGGIVAAHAEPPGYYKIGATPSAAQIDAWSIAIPPDGSRLPPGSGTVDQGGDIFGAECAACHGAFGEGVAAYPKLVGGVSDTGTGNVPKTVGAYWPYATTLWDYINRSMPFYAPHSLKPDQVYALSAWILNMNGIVPDNFVADAKSITAVKMPNRNGFILKDPRPLIHDTECMTNCATQKSLTIESEAKGNHLTPKTTGPVDTMQSTK